MKEYLVVTIPKMRCVVNLDVTLEYFKARNDATAKKKFNKRFRQNKDAKLYSSVE